MLVDAALNGLLLASVASASPSQSNSEDKKADEAISDETAATVGTNRDVDEAYALYESLMEEIISVDDVCSKDLSRGSPLFWKKRLLHFGFSI